MTLALMSFRINSPHPHSSFNEEVGMPLAQPSATAFPYHQAPAFTAANVHAGERAGSPYGLPTLSHFMPEHQHPQAIVFGQPLLLQAPAVNPLPPLVLDQTVFPCHTKKAQKLQPSHLIL
ncbi:hypothetical protein DSO57_1029484 [Entomophthora muscae]|uniref:Uncharacterized protein n=1 Tax=Entomophthora muscae TaxID=34485 RepID=A0ACC2TCF9_9FUNG|nr:hypothetical protein DSO57_1029484 [Entomophthora muscae]